MDVKLTPLSAQGINALFLLTMIFVRLAKQLSITLTHSSKLDIPNKLLDKLLLFLMMSKKELSWMEKVWILDKD